MRSGRLLRRRSGGRLLSPQSGKPPDARIILIHPTALTQTLAVTSMKGGAALSATRPRALHVFNDPIGHPPSRAAA